jgi:hypothetical protein
MKVIAIETVRYEGSVIAKDETFEHKDPMKAIELGLVKLAEDGEESASSGIGGSDKKAKGKGKED